MDPNECVLACPNCFHVDYQLYYARNAVNSAGASCGHLVCHRCLVNLRNCQMCRANYRVEGVTFHKVTHFYTIVRRQDAAEPETFLPVYDELDGE